MPLPQIIMPDLEEHLEKVKALHDKDLDEGYAGAFMFDLIEKKLIITDLGEDLENLPKKLISRGFVTSCHDSEIG